MLIESASACHPFWVGVDVGKESLSVYIAASDKALTIPNKTSAIKDFLRQYPAATLALEPTGGYETKIITLAIEAGCTVYRVNARRVRAFMESLGIYAKTDAIDAKALADFAVANVARLQPFLLALIALFVEIGYQAGCRSVRHGSSPWTQQRLRFGLVRSRR